MRAAVGEKIVGRQRNADGRLFSFIYTRQMLTASRGKPENACTHAQGINERLWACDSGYANLFSHVDQRGESWRMEKWLCHR